MNILVVSALWRDDNAEGNTYSNWFAGDLWKEEFFSNFFWRSQQPNNPVCIDYYRITELELLKKILTRELVGNHFVLQNNKVQSDLCLKEEKTEKRLINLLHKRPFHLAYFIKEALQRNLNWRNKRFICYIRRISPDIVFGTAGGVMILPAFINCVKKYTDAKFALYISDDVYGKFEKYPFFRGKPLLRNFEWAMQHADKLYGASELLCQEYGKRFDVEITPLYKGCEFAPVRVKQNDRIKLVYAGNLFYGRDETLAILAEAVREINKHEPTALLEIYTGTPVSEEMKKKLNLDGASRVMGQRPYEEIKEILNSADIVLHVESFEQKQIDYVHYSFSTKIIDCLQSGSVTMAIGPAGIASIEYIRNIPGTIVVDDLQNVYTMLNEAVQGKTDFSDMAKKTREFAMEHHEIHNVREKLRADFEELLKTKD